MKRRDFALLGTAGLTATLVSSFSFASTSDISSIKGDWFGVLAAGSINLQLRLEIINDHEGNLYSINQGNGKIPASKFMIKGNELYAEFGMIGATFKATFSDKEINGIFHQGSDIALSFFRAQQSTKTEYPPLTQAKLDDILKETHAPAMVAICEANNVTPKLFLSGNRKFDSDIKVTPNDLWHLGSITKSFTALLIGILVEKGILNWNEPIGKTFGNYIKTPKPYDKVTLLHLLSHHAGLQANLELQALITYKSDTRPIITQRHGYVSKVFEQEPIAQPAQKFLYSNSGFVIAGHIAEFKCGKSWEELMREYVFKPLGITSAGFGAPGTYGKIDEPLGHYTNPITDKPESVFGGNALGDNPKVLGPAGTIHIAPNDMIKYLMARAQRNPIVTKPTWERLETPPFSGNYALGVICKQDGLIWHNGSNTLWYAEAAYYPNIAKAAFAATNYGDLNKVPVPTGKILMMSLAAV